MRHVHRARALRTCAAVLSLVVSDYALAQGEAKTETPDVSATAPAEKQRAPSESIEEITVTGSYLKRARTDGPQAVTVVDRFDIEALGVQSPIDVIEKLTINAGSEFRSDAFKAGGQYGTANINLRGLGLGTTLVLVDGRRQVLSGAVSNDGASFVDINNLPLQMIERVEVLKEGAAATYGSDAVAGVVNFITRKDFEGFELTTQYQTTTEGGQREQGISGLWGWGTERIHLQAFANYFDSNQLSSTERSFTQAKRNSDGSFVASSPFGRSTLGNPGALQRLSNGQTERDPRCAAAGGTPIGTRCGFEFADNFNLADHEQRAKYAFTFGWDIDETTRLDLKWNYAYNKIDDVGFSPSFPPAIPFFVPANNPGNFVNEDALFIGRPLAENDATRRGFYYNRTNRYEAALAGVFDGAWSWDLNVSYASSLRNSNFPDTFNTELGLALLGYGGSGCDFVPAGFAPEALRTISLSDVAGLGRQIDVDGSRAGSDACKFFVPGSEAFLNPDNANDEDVIQFISGRLKDDTRTDLLVAEGVVTGELFDLPAGPVGMALGYQYRREQYDVSRNRDSVTRTGEPSRFIFQGGGSEFDSDLSVTALFSELSIPVRNDLELQLAVRFEDYNGAIGSSVDPKIAFKWDPNDWLGIRGSFSTTFRAPTLSQQRSERTINELIQDVSNAGFLPIDNRGNAELKPEEADVYNFGLQLRPLDNLSATIDYFRIDFSDLVVQEDAQTLVDKENALNGVALAGRCNDPAFRASPSVTRLTGGGAGAICPISRIQANFVNANAVLTDGIDVSVVYDMDVAGFDSVRLTTDLTHIIQYDIQTEDGTIKAAGNRNERNFARALPKWRVNTGVTGVLGPHSGGLTVRYISSYDDDDNSNVRIDDHTTVDLFYAYQLSTIDATLQVGVIDLFDREPPFVNTDFNFDSRTHDARGRRLYSFLRWRF